MDWFIRVVQGKFIGPKAEYQIDKKKSLGWLRVCFIPPAFLVSLFSS